MPVLSSTLADWAVYFPLGLIFSLQAKRLMPQLQKLCWVLLALTGVFFALTVLDAATVISFPMAAHICPLAFIAFSPTLKRDAIPLVRHFEKIGKKSYGLYLTHLIVLDLTLLALRSAAPWLLGQQLLLMLLLFSVALGIPLALMNGVERIPTRGAYRYIFG
jgi:peptidoglycan/LPS O-acetylase OafA/YrhL